MKKAVILILLMLSVVSGTLCVHADTYTDGSIGYGQYGNVFVFCIEKDTGIKTDWAMNFAENGGPILNDEVGVLMPMESMCALQTYEYKKQESGFYYISNGLRTIIIPKDKQLAYVNGRENKFEYSIINDDVYFPYTYIDMLFDLQADWNNEEHCLTLTERESTPVSDTEVLFRKSPKTISVKSDNEVLSVSINDKPIAFNDAQPFIDENDRTQVPVRVVAEMLGCDVIWNDNDRTIEIADESNKVKLEIGSDIINVGGAKITMDTTAIIKSDRTYIPIRFITEALGYMLQYNDTHQ